MNMFIDESNERGLEKFEKEFGIVPLPGKSMEERRIAVMLRTAKENLNYKDVLKIIKKYSEEIDLKPDYNKDELEVIVGDMVNNIRGIYKTLDEIMGLNVYIYFTYITMVILSMQETAKIIEMETQFRSWLDFGQEKIGAELQTKSKTVEEFRDATVTMQKDLWKLDGSVKLDGSRKLDAEERKESI